MANVIDQVLDGSFLAKLAGSQVAHQNRQALQDGEIPMALDIHQFDDVAIHETGKEAEWEDFLAELMKEFLDSPEGREASEAAGDAELGFWAHSLLSLGLDYESETPARMTSASVRSVLLHLFPRKISVMADEEIATAIPELQQFWRYLKRQYSLPQADDILKMLDEIGPTFQREMKDSSNFGMAKSFFSAGTQAGFDMNDESQLKEFLNRYNAAIQGQAGEEPQRSAASSPMDNEQRRARKEKKRRRKQARKQRRKNRRKGR